MMLQVVAFIPTDEFPHLTHLALLDINTSDCHIKIARLLSRCPNLESLVIWHSYIPHPPLDLPENFPHSLTLNRLHRVTLRLQLLLFRANIMDLYLSFFPQGDSTPEPTALQILDLNITDNMSTLSEMLLRITKAEASHLSLALRPYEESHFMYLSITAAGPKGTLHVSTESFHGMSVQPQAESDASPKTFLSTILRNYAHLRVVREVWVTATPPPPDRPPLHDAMDHFRSTIAALPALETIVLTVTTIGSQLEVDLGLCPSAHDPGFASPNLKTLRIVHGNGMTGKRPVEKIRLTSLLDQIGTGAYGYFENVLLEMTRRLVVDGEDLARLRARFSRVTFQYFDSMPTMSLPDYCTEPYAGPGGSSTWHGSLW